MTLLGGVYQWSFSTRPASWRTHPSSGRGAVETDAGGASVGERSPGNALLCAGRGIIEKKPSTDVKYPRPPLFFLRILCASIPAFTLKVSHAPISVECIFSTTLISGVSSALDGNQAASGERREDRTPSPPDPLTAGRQSGGCSSRAPQAPQPGCLRSFSVNAARGRGALRTSTPPTLNPRYTEVWPVLRLRVHAHSKVPGSVGHHELSLRVRMSIHPDGKP